MIDHQEVMEKRLHTIEHDIKMLFMSSLEIAKEVSSVKANLVRLNAKIAVEAREQQKTLSSRDIVDQLAEKLNSSLIHDISSEIDGQLHHTEGTATSGVREDNFDEGDERIRKPSRPK